MQMITQGYGTNLFLLLMDMGKNEIVEGLEDLSQAAIFV